MSKTRPTAKPTPATRRPTGPNPDNRRLATRWALTATAVVAVVAVLYAVFASSSTTTSGKDTYQAGSPGIGATAPGFTLAASTGGKTSLAAYKGKTVLLYFQEGLTCQPCWDQLTDLEKNAAQLKAAGIDLVLSITSDPADLIAQKTRDMKLTTPVLSDPGLTVSQTYDANAYGMMGASRDGHTFILVGPDGTIRWRADYGGAPNYTMYVAPAQLLADLKAGETKTP